MRLTNTRKNWLQQLLSKFIIYMTLCLWGGAVYWSIEMIYRGYSHAWMYVLGGICLIWLGNINNLLPWDLGFIWQVIIGTIGVVILEFIFGLILNVWLGLGIWDYSNLKFNILGQVSLLFFVLFMPVVAFGIWLYDFLRWKLLREEKPRYTLL